MTKTKQILIRDGLEKENVKYRDILRIPKRIINKLNKHGKANYAGFIINCIMWKEYNYVVHSPNLTKDKLVYYEISYYERLREV